MQKTIELVCGRLEPEHLIDLRKEMEKEQENEEKMKKKKKKGIKRNRKII